MTANINPKTGIAYGVISLNSLAEWVYDEFFHNGKNLTYEYYLEAWKKEHNLTDENDADTYNASIDEFNDGYQSEEEEYELEVDGMKLGLSCLGGAYNVWVYESPYTALVRKCSPCCPNAGDLDSRHITEKEYKAFLRSDKYHGYNPMTEAYDLPAEWYDAKNVDYAKENPKE